MRINFSDYDLSEFIIKEGIFCGIPAKLITPNHIGTKFNQKNAIFRSSIWDLDGNLISAGLPKFTNLFENPENFPFHNDGKHIFVSKIDGSLAICDYVNNQYSVRTRGCFTYEDQLNYKDFEFCLNDKIKFALKANPDYSFLFELTSRNQKIVLDYGDKPEFWLVAIIDKKDYTLFSQESLDVIAPCLCVKRPETYCFNNIDEAVKNIKLWKNLEGVCVYNEKYGSIHKIKAEEYLARHRFREHANLETVFELFLSWEYPNKQDFYNKIGQIFDYECFEKVKIFVDVIIFAYEQTHIYFHDINNFVLPFMLNNTPRKEAALSIINKYKDLGLTSFAFSALDGKRFDIKDTEKLMKQILKIK